MSLLQRQRLPIGCPLFQDGDELFVYALDDRYIDLADISVGLPPDLPNQFGAELAHIMEKQHLFLRIFQPSQDRGYVFLRHQFGHFKWTVEDGVQKIPLPYLPRKHTA